MLTPDREANACTQGDRDEDSRRRVLEEEARESEGWYVGRHPVCCAIPIDTDACLLVRVPV